MKTILICGSVILSIAVAVAVFMTKGFDGFDGDAT
jgi:hypothetical protein